jgi:hypothetical protein
MQEVSGSIPLGSTIFSDQMNVRGTFIRKNPKPKAREAAQNRTFYSIVG